MQSTSGNGNGLFFLSDFPRSVGAVPGIGASLDLLHKPHLGFVAPCCHLSSAAPDSWDAGWIREGLACFSRGSDQCKRAQHQDEETLLKSCRLVPAAEAPSRMKCLFKYHVFLNAHQKDRI